jgi:hypothetical protein
LFCYLHGLFQAKQNTAWRGTSIVDVNIDGAIESGEEPVEDCLPRVPISIHACGNEYMSSILG